ncbi:chemotaxis protein CheB [Maribellus sp. YY47]|uniref:chemotaxis protein CheB n=1 Tax=Maribellus sp. YY47 TaxID=2929486 RepID=UPI0020007690|nr:chemotaxis protein CheB [Maribellus sp. YY47]MCK3685251.1 chemotaxis protein CheB [Maribellus sp. YY47]
MYRAIVIGTSHGGLEALKTILPELKKDFPIPVVVVLHIGEHSNDFFIRHLNEDCELEVKEAEANEPVLPGYIYFAPPGYHLQIEDNSCFSLSTEKKLNFSRPSIDVLFETAAWAYKNQLIGIILTGANSDGANGLRIIKQMGGKTIIQNPCHAISPTMPRFALRTAQPDIRLDLEEIPAYLNQLIVTQ